MERYLLFDSGCSLCTSLARQVEEAADGKLTVRSLRDPEVRSILDEVKPGWRWEPMLLEMDGDRRRVYAGIGLRARLVRVLGPRRAVRLAQIVQSATVFQPGRRGMLRLAGGLLAGLTLSGWLSGSAKAGDGPEPNPTTRVFLPTVVNSSGVNLLAQLKASPEFQAVRTELFTQFPTAIQHGNEYTFLTFDLGQPIRTNLTVEVYPYVIFVVNQDRVVDMIRVIPDIGTRQAKLTFHNSADLNRIVVLSDNVVFELTQADGRVEAARQLAEQQGAPTILRAGTPDCELRCRWECRNVIHHPGHEDWTCWSVCTYGCTGLGGNHWACGAGCYAACYVPAYDECTRWEKVCTREC
ncbi:MAG: hypothetical protein D6694_06625 [Gammaproteobacteria bacterium]|nr:MAG: hypothetical protein D6694_06625 [Gammaproteobacteria bacterium]